MRVRIDDASLWLRIFLALEGTPRNGGGAVENAKRADVGVAEYHKRFAKSPQLVYRGKPIVHRED